MRAGQRGWILRPFPSLARVCRKSSFLLRASGESAHVCFLLPFHNCRNTLLVKQTPLMDSSPSLSLFLQSPALQTGKQGDVGLKSAFLGGPLAKSHSFLRFQPRKMEPFLFSGEIAAGKRKWKEEEKNLKITKPLLSFFSSRKRPMLEG